MSRIEKCLAAVALLLFALATQFPLWRIEIWAPQYPEGLVMKIWMDAMTGNIDQVNILNHYVGMRKIVPAGIPELHFLPSVFLGLLILGGLATAFGKRRALRIWLGFVVGGGLVGLVDFYKWGYDYGHNLNSHAPIKVQGLTYQPPLIGHKTLLNIDSYSLPDIGTYVLLIAVALVAYVGFCDMLARRFWAVPLKSPNASATQIFKKVAPVLALLFLVSCTPSSEPFHIGADECAHCHMRFSEAKFGGEIITKKGRVEKFDSIPCLREGVKEEKDNIAKILVVNFEHPDQFVSVDQAYFVSSKTVHGPMGGEIAFSTIAAAEKYKANEKIKQWQDVLAN